MNTTSLGHIYKIICKVDEKFCYIGSTFNRLSKRMEIHRCQYNKWVNGETKNHCACVPYFQKYGVQNFKIVLIKSYEVCRAHNKDTNHLRAYETLWINKTKCVNKYLPIDYLKKEKKREYQKEYHKKNKEELRAKQREYHEKNKEEICAKKREYHEKHREERNAKQRERYEKNKEEQNAKSREYREKHREEQNAKKREKIECEFCGSVVSKGSISKHRKTQKCLKAQGK